jgi:putative addiction module component (TIGR02574 family)
MVADEMSSRPQRHEPLMNPETQALLDAALALPEAQRALLVECLLESLPSEPDTLTDAQLEAEMDRRFGEYQRDPSVGIPWSDIKRPG